MDDCVFCKIIEGEIPGEVFMENQDFLAIRDINPKAPQHLLVIPREHVASLEGTEGWPDEKVAEMFRFVRMVADKAGIRDSGYRVLSNVGEDAGQVVFHLHVHVVGGARLEHSACAFCNSFRYALRTP